MNSLRFPAIAAGLIAAAAALAPPPAPAAERTADADFAKRMFAGSVPNPKAYACFVRRYDAAHLAQHPLQKVSVMKLLIGTEKDPDFAEFQYAFRVGVNFRDRPGDFDSSGNCGHAPTVTDPADANIPPQDRVTLPAGLDFQCNVDCDGGGIAISLANADNAAIVKLDHIRIWKGTNPDSKAAGALEAGADDKVFRLDRTTLSDCTSLVADRKELAAMRRKR
ncbi:MAG TPA: hypothetical protein VHX43_14940 [Xanthobacteraceae bacterium]|jgi:hypothetical protein|nr:hypothetical protein [Xanthobacteraceae bacterium]